MKRVLALLSLVCALFAVSACHFDVNLSVDADATLFYADTAVIPVGPSHYEGFHHKHLTDYDLEDIFIDLTKHVQDNFTSAVLHLAIHGLRHYLTARPRNTKKGQLERAVLSFCAAGN